MIALRRMQIAELEHIAEIDRSEHVTKIYVNRDGTLIRKDVDWPIPRWSPAGPPQQALPKKINPQKHTVPAKVKAWRPILENGGAMVGAFADKTLVGFVIYLPTLSPDTAQIEALNVSKDYRGRGIGTLLVDKAVQLAKADGVKKLYVSSVPTAPTVDFYVNKGFELAEEVNQKLYELEPEDIHMIKIL
jgi:GNAT superfamily N-acetyltransferase